MNNGINLWIFLIITVVQFYPDAEAVLKPVSPSEEFVPEPYKKITFGPVIPRQDGIPLPGIQIIKLRRKPKPLKKICEECLKKCSTLAPNKTTSTNSTAKNNGTKSNNGTNSTNSTNTTSDANGTNATARHKRENDHYYKPFTFEAVKLPVGDRRKHQRFAMKRISSRQPSSTNNKQRGKKANKKFKRKKKFRRLYRFHIETPNETSKS